MSDELENLLGRVTPRGAPPELRSHVISLVTNELGAPARPKRRSGLAWMIFVGIFAAVTLNVWVNERHRARLAELYGPDPPATAVEDLRKLIESATDAETAQWFSKRLQTVKPRIDLDSLRREQAILAATADS
jgi:hypothetical protein